MGQPGMPNYGDNGMMGGNFGQQPQGMYDNNNFGGQPGGFNNPMY
jgi:hypothetical protein